MPAYNVNSNTRPDRRTSRGLASAVAVALMATVLAACGGSSQSGDSSGKISAKTPLTVPLIMGSTGAYAAYRYDNSIPAQLLINSYNAHPHPGSPPLKLKIYEDNSQVSQAVVAFNQITSDTKPVIIVGSISAVSAALAPKASGLKIPYIDPIATDTQIASSNRPWAFIPSPELQSFSTAGVKRWLADMHGQVTSVATLSDNSDSAPEEQAQALTNGLKSAGVKVSGQVTYSNGVTDFSPLAHKVVSSRATAVMLCGEPTDGLAMIEAVRTAGFNGPILVCDNELVDSFYSSIKGHGNGVYGVNDYFPYAKGAAFTKYVKQFKAKSGGHTPDVYITYAGWTLITKAIAAAHIDGMTVSQARAAIDKQLTKVSMTSALTNTKLQITGQGNLEYPPLVINFGTTPATLLGS